MKNPQEKQSRSAMQTLENCVKIIRSKTNFVPKLAIVLGSGLGDFANLIQQEAVVSYDEIDTFPRSTVEGHAGRFVFGYVGSLPIVCMQGRVHFYEGYDMQDVVLPIRIMKLLGADYLVLTNAAGGCNPDFSPGDLMMITDHIATAVPSPLLGENLTALGARFPDMSSIYDKQLSATLQKTASEQAINLKQGVYFQFSGPQYETPAEIRMVRMLGADAVGMSTACEAIAANHMGMKLCGISCITNLAAGLSNTPLDHSEVQATADRAATDFAILLTSFLKKLGESS